MSEVAQQPKVYADPGARFAAAILDLILLGSLYVLAFHELHVPREIEVALSLAFFLLYFGGMPLTPLQGTFGKRAAGIMIRGKNGERIGWRASLARAVALPCWIILLVWLPEPVIPGFDALSSLRIPAFFLAWIPMVVLPSRRSLFDLLAGTAVVRREPKAAAKPAGKRGLAGTIVSLVVLCLVVGGLAAVFVPVYNDKNRLGRVLYAVEATRPLREKVEAHYAREKRWPTAQDLGVAESTPYPDGGGYRLQPEGVIVISFSVLPELKGHSVTFRPKPAEGGKIEWQCRGDAAMKPKYLPAYCRN